MANISAERSRGQRPTGASNGTGPISRISGISSGGAQAWQAANEVFRVDSWVQCLLGQRLEPQRWHRLGAVMSEGRVRQNLAEIAQGIASHVETTPGHQQFLDGYCAG